MRYLKKIQHPILVQVRYDNIKCTGRLLRQFNMIINYVLFRSAFEVRSFSMLFGFQSVLNQDRHIYRQTNRQAVRQAVRSVAWQTTCMWPRFYLNIFQLTVGCYTLHTLDQVLNKLAKHVFSCNVSFWSIITVQRTFHTVAFG